MNANEARTLLWSFSKAELISICNGLQLPSFGERGDMIKEILDEYSAEDISRLGLNKNKTKGVPTYTVASIDAKVGCLTCGK